MNTNEQIEQHEELTQNAMEEAAKVAAKKLYDFDPGQHSIHFNLNVSATVSKSEYVTKVVPQAACFQTLFALALSKLNGSTAAVVSELVSEVMQMSEKERKVLRESVKDETKSAMAEIGQETTKVVAGPTRFSNIAVAVDRFGSSEEEVDREFIAALADALAG